MKEATLLFYFLTTLIYTKIVNIDLTYFFPLYIYEPPFYLKSIWSFVHGLCLYLIVL